MKTNIAALVAVIGLIAGVVTMGFTARSTALAEEPGLPGMCNGRTDANVILNAHANGSRAQGVPKFILNIWTDASGHPFGALILGQGKDRIAISEWCRLWLHQPGDPPEGGGQCEGDEGHDPNQDMVNAHVVGVGWKNGQKILVRTDVRSNEEGMFFRVRYRALEQHHEDGHVDAAAHEDEDDCEGGGWTREPEDRVAPPEPAQGSLPLASPTGNEQRDRHSAGPFVRAIGGAQPANAGHCFTSIPMSK